MNNEILISPYLCQTRKIFNASLLRFNSTAHLQWNKTKVSEPSVTRKIKFLNLQSLKLRLLKLAEVGCLVNCWSQDLTLPHMTSCHTTIDLCFPSMDLAPVLGQSHQQPGVTAKDQVHSLTHSPSLNLAFFLPPSIPSVLWVIPPSHPHSQPLQVNIQKDCGEDNICIPDLRIVYSR